jgi:hypothetical protein
MMDKLFPDDPVFAMPLFDNNPDPPWIAQPQPEFHDNPKAPWIVRRQTEAYPNLAWPIRLALKSIGLIYDSYRNLEPRDQAYVIMLVLDFRDRFARRIGHLWTFECLNLKHVATGGEVFLGATQPLGDLATLPRDYCIEGARSERWAKREGKPPRHTVRYAVVLPMQRGRFAEKTRAPYDPAVRRFFLGPYPSGIFPLLCVAAGGCVRGWGNLATPDQIVTHNRIITTT